MIKNDFSSLENLTFITNRVTREDQITFISTQSSKGLGAAFEKVPDLIEKLMATKNGKKAKEEEVVA